MYLPMVLFAEELVATIHTQVFRRFFFHLELIAFMLFGICFPSDDDEIIKLSKQRARHNPKHGKLNINHRGVSYSQKYL